MGTEQITAADLTGRWRLTSFVEIDEQGTTLESPVGPDPLGSIFYGADGHVSVHIMRTDGKPYPAVAYIGYTGTWQLTGDQVVHHVEIAADPTWSGTEQVRDVITLSGDDLVLGRAWEVDGRAMRARMEWRRR